MKRIFLSLITVLSFSMFSCAPYQQEMYKEVGPNESTFVVPLEEGTKEQKQLKSIEYLEAKKVSTKRINIPTRSKSTGRWWWQSEWIPTVRVITVNRALVTREWTSTEGTGTSSSNQAMNVESKNSIGFYVGITATGSILEEDAATYLYWHGEKPLSEVMDTNIRSFILDQLTTGFGSRDLTQCQNDRKAVYDSMKVATRKFFKSRGITLDNIGAAGEFTYMNPDIQAAINKEFVAEKTKDAAVNEVAAAREYQLASEAIKAQKNLEADVLIKKAIASAIESGKLQVPQTVVMGGNNSSLIDLWAAKNINNPKK